MIVEDGDLHFGVVRRKVKDKLSKRPMHVHIGSFRYGRNHTMFWAFNTLDGILGWYKYQEEHTISWERSRCFIMVGHTRYDMPSENENFEEFIRHCLDVEAAFFDNKDCQRVLDEAGSMG